MGRQHLTEFKDLCLHLVVGFVVFALIVGSALLLHMAVEALEHAGVSPVITYCLEGLHYLIVFLDIGLFLIFLYRTTVGFISSDS